ncbi:MAG: entericidin A/B family lipoprotein [Gammaproteobacteria bacterium]|nr:entericidin A/B family lipoprotein [Gammaproteobacteria bacterium]
MKYMTVITLMLLGALASGCETIEGAGQDIENAGDQIEDATDS